MGIQGDFNELKKAWSSFSPLTKVFFGAIFFGSCLSVSSIADGVFKLRGFIVTAIDFYHSLVQPLTAFIAEYVGLDLGQGQVDGIILMTLITTSIIRVNRVRGPRDVKADIMQIISWGSMMGGIIFLDDGSGRVSRILISCFVIIILLAVVYPRMVFKVAEVASLGKRQYGRRDELYFIRGYKLAVINILAVSLFVAVVAGVSEGLSRVKMRKMGKRRNRL